MYVSAGRQEYYIIRDSLGWWRIKPYGYQRTPPILQSSFDTFHACERHLVSYLKKTDRWNRAIYPDKYGPSRTS